MMEQYLSEIIALLSGISGVIVGWLTKRKKEKMDIRDLEVEILQKILNIIDMDVVEPLRRELIIEREEREKDRNELNLLKNAIEKRNDCHLDFDCPIISELQKQQDRIPAKPRRKLSAKRQRKIDRGANRGPGTDTSSDIPDEYS